MLKSNQQQCPIIGFNVIKHLVSESMRDVTNSGEKEKLLRAVKLSFPHQNVRTINEIVTVPSQSSVFIECGAKVKAFKEDIALVFEPCENPQWPDDLEFCDTLVSVKKGSVSKITVSVQNLTNHVITLLGRTTIGTV